MEIQTFNNTSNYCSLCLEKSNSNLSPLTAESHLETIYYTNILASGRSDYSDFHLSACDKCLQQLNSFQNFIKTCQSSYEFIMNKSCLISKSEDAICEEEQEDLHLELDVSDENDCEETNETEPKKPNYSWGTVKLCPFCSKQFMCSSKLNRHMSVHTGYAPFKCSFCDKRMQFKNDLKNHERTHTGERPFVCLTCNKAFTQNIVLNTHIMMMHTGRKEKCEICEKTFCRPGDVRVHMRIHTGEAPYKCSVCDKAFPTSSGCKSHMITHSDKRSFICKHCGSAFKRNQSLRKHEGIHKRRGEKPFRCQQCDYVCRTSPLLKMHVKSCHRVSNLNKLL